MRKLSIVLLGLVMFAISANAQSVDEMFTSFGKLPTEAEIVAAVKTSAAFADKIKALEGPISKLEKADKSDESGESDESDESEQVAAALAMAASNRQRMMSDPDGWAAEMEKRAELQEKMMTFMEFQTNLMNMNRKYEGMLEELDQSEDDSAYSERYSQLQNKYKHNDLDSVNQFYRELYALDCETSSKKINKRMDIIRKYYDELVTNKAKIKELCEVTDEFYKLSGMDMAAQNPARMTLIGFAKLYKKVLEEYHPNSLIQYKSMKEYYESAG